MSDTNAPGFRSGLRRLLYPAISRPLPAETDPSEHLEETLHRLSLRSGDCSTLPAAQRYFDGRFVDVATGEVLIDQVDLAIPGPVPFRWSRCWRSLSLTAGPLGNGWRHAYEYGLLEDRRSRQVVIRLPDNRGVLFPILAEGETALHRSEKLRLRRDTHGYRLQNAEGLGYRFAPNATGSLCRLVAVDRLGTPYRLQFSYTSTGYLRRISDDVQRVIDVITDPQGRITRLEMAPPDQPQQRVTLVAYQYDESGNLTEVTVQNQRTFQYHYRQHRIIRLTDAFRQSTYLTYEKVAQQYACTAVKQDSHLTSLSFHYLPTEGRTQVTDGTGRVRQYSHEGGFVQRFMSAGGRQRAWFFNEYGELLNEQDALGNTSFFTYDEQGRQTQSAWPDGGILQMQYDDEGQLIALLDRAGGSWLWTYDAQGRLRTCTDPVGAQTQFTYNEVGLLTEQRQPDGQWLRWEYDPYGNPKTRTTATGSRIEWAYDFLGQLVSATSETTPQVPDTGTGPLGSTRSNGVPSGDGLQPTFDADGQLIRLRRSDRLNWQFIRDAAGRVREYTRPDGCSTRFHYDPAGRLTEVLFSDDSWYHYTYRPDGWLIEAASPTTLVQFGRDPLGRIVTETAGPTVVQSVYDGAGHRTALQSSAQATVAYDYDDQGRLRSQRHPTEPLQITYDRLGRPIERQLPGGLRSRWQYDAGPLPTSHQLFWGSSLQAARLQTYGWEGQQLVRLQDSRFGTVHLRYDLVGQPTEAVCSAGWTDRWVAERTQYQQRLLKPAPETAERGWQLIIVGALRFYYDAEGYLREKREAGQVWQFEWHESGVLQRVIRPDKQVVLFTYDALGRRLEKTVGDRTVRWAWDGQRLLHEWHQNTGSEPVQWTWYTAGGTEPTLLQIGENRYSIVSNYLGQPLSIHDGQGQAVWEWRWCLFGKKRNLTGPGQAPALLGPGQYEDPEAGLVYARFRYYDGETGLPLSPEYSSPAGWARAGWEPPHAPESYLSAARCIRVY